MQSTQRVFLPFTILNGASLSGAVAVDRGRIVGIAMPAAWTAAGVALQAAMPDGSFQNVITSTDGSAVALATSPVANNYVHIPDGSQIVAPGIVKVRSGTNAVPVNQGADRAGWLVVLLPA